MITNVVKQQFFAIYVMCSTTKSIDIINIIWNNDSNILVPLKESLKHYETIHSWYA